MASLLKFFGKKSMLLALFLILIVVIAGCVTAPKGGEESSASNISSTGGEQQQIPQPEQQESPQPKAQCTKDSDCNDNSSCTTDSCVSGVCKNIATPSCELKTDEKPKIASANFGNLFDEYVQISGKNWKINGWKITNSKGDVFIKFDKNDYLVINGKIIVYSRCGDLPTTITKYQCLEKDFFSDTGDKAFLYDENNTLVDQKAG